jgi:hypothetical protein
VKLDGVTPNVMICGVNVTVAPGGIPVAERVIGKGKTPPIGWIVKP